MMAKASFASLYWAFAHAAIFEEGGQFQMELRVQQFMTTLTQKYEQLGTTNARDNFFL